MTASDLLYIIHAAYTGQYDVHWQKYGLSLKFLNCLCTDYLGGEAYSDMTIIVYASLIDVVSDI